MSRARAGDSRIAAILGPTNTGKTHLALERMMAHSTGVFGLPLRSWRASSMTRSSRPRVPPPSP
jgi:hypothetical protein